MVKDSEAQGGLKRPAQPVCATRDIAIVASSAPLSFCMTRGLFAHATTGGAL